jgi:branched-chain amino acid aminotransferase
VSYVYCQGRIVAEDEARISALDAGLLYGDGIYETVRVYGGRVFALARHLARLGRSAARVGLRLPSREDVAAAVAETIAANRLESAIVRVTITRGRLARRLDLSSAGPATIVVVADPYDVSADAERRRGIRVAYSKYVRLSQYPLAGVKSTNYQVSLLARNEAREAGAVEVLLADETGAIVEAAAANVFAVAGAKLITPSLSRGILGGITREVVLEIARADGIDVVEDALAPARLEAADEVFLTGTTIQVAPVVRVGDRPMGGGVPGRTTLHLLDRYVELVAAETGAAAGAREGRP